MGQCKWRVTMGHWGLWMCQGKCQGCTSVKPANTTDSTWSQEKPWSSSSCSVSKFPSLWFLWGRKEGDDSILVWKKRWFLALDKNKMKKKTITVQLMYDSCHLSGYYLAFIKQVSYIHIMIIMMSKTRESTTVMTKSHLSTNKARWSWK